MTVDVYALAQRLTGVSVNDCAVLGNGLINDTFLLQTADGPRVLQRINVRVFKKPSAVYHNLQCLAAHLRGKAPGTVQLHIPAVLGQIQDQQGDYWRLLEWIADSESRETMQRDSEAQQIGFALAHFHKLCSDLACDSLHDTLPGFHVTPEYFQQYQALQDELPLVLSEYRALLSLCQSTIAALAPEMDVLESARQQGILQERVIHGDPKLNNFLFREGADHIISLVDLDTVKPGLIHYDIGDCLRSCCHGVANQFDLARAQLILQSYLQEAGEFLTDADYDYLYASLWLIPFELGLRFFSDFLAGNSYFKIDYPEHNLVRAAAQFALCRSVRAQRVAIENMIDELRR